jgi:hypothetical protein
MPKQSDAGCASKNGARLVVPLQAAPRRPPWRRAAAGRHPRPRAGLISMGPGMRAIIAATRSRALEHGLAQLLA